MRSSAECSDTLQHLGRVLLVVQGHSLEDVMRLEIQRGRLAGTKEVGDVFHLNERHRRLFEADAWRSCREVDKPALQIRELLLERTRYRIIKESILA